MGQDIFDEDKFEELADRTPAFNYCKKCVEEDENDVNALFQLGECYYYGIGTAVNNKEARKTFKTLLKLNPSNKTAKEYLVLILVNKISKIFDNFVKVVCALVILQFLFLFLEGLLVFESKEDTFYSSKTSVVINPNDKQAWYFLGDHYRYGIGTEVDEEKAFECYINVIELDETFISSSTWYYLGNCYLYGNGTEVDEEKAFECFKKATEQYESLAYMWSQLGFCYADGIGTEIDEEKAFKCFKKANDLNIKFSAYWYYLGGCYQNGIGTEVNEKKAFECYKKSLELYKTKKYVIWRTLYNCCQSVVGKVFDYKEALEIHKTNGVAIRLALGECYLKGIGTNVNVAKAKKMLTKALELAPDNEDTKSLLAECGE